MIRETLQNFLGAQDRELKNVRSVTAIAAILNMALEKIVELERRIEVLEQSNKEVDDENNSQI